MLRTTTLGTLKMDRLRQEDDVTSSPSRIPVFVFPASIVFNAFDRDHLKQILTIYNPYEFPIRFKGIFKCRTEKTLLFNETASNN